MKPPTTFAFSILLILIVTAVSCGTITYQELIQNSANFASTFRAFPVQNNLISTLAKYPDHFPQDSFVRQAEGVRILVHRRILGMMDSFLQHKRTHGSAVECALYASMTRDQFIDRLLQKRPLTFMNKADTTLTRAPLNYYESAQEQWFRVGTDHEVAPFLLQDYLSYDEMELSAFLNVATPTHFINDGNRKNNGVYGANGTYQRDGIYIAAVGARFEVPGKMERRYLDPNRARSNDPMFQQWESLYEVNADQAVIPFDYSQIDPEDPNPDPNPPNVNRHGYAVRMQLTLEPLILYANHVAGEQGRKARLRLVGLGIGVWAVNQPEQGKVIVEVVKNIIRSHDLPHITMIELSWFPNDALLSGHPLDNVKRSVVNDPANFTAWTHISGQVADRQDRKITLEQNRVNPAAPINQGELLVAVYAWDSNSFPGNEYWIDRRDDSGDPAAACCSTIQELQNPFINTSLRAATKLLAYGSEKGQDVAAGHHPQQQQQASPPPAPLNPPRALRNGPPAPAAPPTPAPAASPNVLPPRQPLASPNAGASPQWPPSAPSRPTPNQQAARSPTVPSDISFELLLHNSQQFEEFFHPFPLQTNKIQTLAERYPKESFVKQAAGARIILHDRIFQMMQSFLLYKRSFGSAVEQKLYARMEVHQFIDRLLLKRPLMFTGMKDRTLLTGKGKTPFDGQKQWFLVGTDREERPLLLADYLSYDEMELSAFVNVATPTYFINFGYRQNAGEPGLPGTFHPEGVVIAASGPRFDVPNRMEHRYLAENRQRKIGDSLFSLWEYVYQASFNHDLIRSPQVNINRRGYEIRMKLTLEPIILYANDVARSQGKTALLRLPGLGLGAWQVVEVELANVMVGVVADIIRNNDLEHLGKIEFLWFVEAVRIPDSVLDTQDHQVVLERSFSYPAAPIDADDSVLLVTVYEWNGNSYPGNEYWLGEFEESRAAVMASCSTIQELQNPFINTDLRAAKRLVLYGAEKPKAPIPVPSPSPAPPAPTTPPARLPPQAGPSSASSSSQPAAPPAYHPPPQYLAAPSASPNFAPRANPPSQHQNANFPLLNPQQLQYNPSGNHPYQNAQAQFPNPQPSYHNAQAQFPNPQPSYHNAQAQFPYPQPSYHNAQQQFPNPQPSYHNAQQQFPSPQPSYHNAQQQFPSPQPSYHNAQTQFPNPQPSYPNAQQFPAPYQPYHNPQQHQHQQQQSPNVQQAYPNPQQHQVPNPQNQQYYYHR
jgi:hypothetical protein